MTYLLLLIAVLVVLAFVTLSRIPRLGGFTVANVIVFVAGGMLGMIGFTRLILLLIDRMLGRIWFEKLTDFFLVHLGISLIGALLGGLSFVAVKTSLVGKLDEHK